MEKATTQLITITPPEQFKIVPWKNGLGSTIELAINEGGTLDSFDWRLSIASVAKDGPFSDFAGYSRNLVLIEGQGITLEYDQVKKDTLNTLLSVAKFDGGAQTIGTLTSGAIKDFNVMVNKVNTRMRVNTFVEEQIIDIPECDLCFIYCLKGEALLSQPSLKLPAGHLLKIRDPKHKTSQISGQQMIVIQLFENTDIRVNS